MQIKTPQTVIVTSNKGGSGKTPLAIALVMWALSRSPPLRVLAVDINHTNQDLFQALRDLRDGAERRFETAFSLPSVGTAYYLPVTDQLHLVRPREFSPLGPEQVFELLREAAVSYAVERGVEGFQPDLIVVDGNYCFPSYRPDAPRDLGMPPFVFMNIWSITSPHELRIPGAYRTTVTMFKDLFGDDTWDSTHFVHVFSVLEKDRGLSTEFSRLVRLRREVYTVPGSDDLADLYRRLATSPEMRPQGFSFDEVQREIFSPMLAELESLVVQDPTAYTEDVVNARWVERVNIFLTRHQKFPLNVFPLPHYYPFLRKAVVDTILRRRLGVGLVREMLGSFYDWVDMFLTRYFSG